MRDGIGILPRSSSTTVRTRSPTPMTTTAAPAFDRPAADEHAPYYARYIDLVPDVDLLDYLQRQMEGTAAFLRAIPEALHGHRYAEGKWSIREMVGHIADTERIFAYRALRFARADQTPLAGFDENAYVPAGQFDRRPLAELIDEFEAVRRATVALVRGLQPEAWTRIGTANGKAISVRALVYIAAGHERDHLGTLRERYGVAG